jgi:hypothetical protein
MCFCANRKRAAVKFTGTFCRRMRTFLRIIDHTQRTMQRAAWPPTDNSGERRLVLDGVARLFFVRKYAGVPLGAPSLDALREKEKVLKKKLKFRRPGHSLWRQSLIYRLRPDRHGLTKSGLDQGFELCDAVSGAGS